MTRCDEGKGLCPLCGRICSNVFATVNTEKIEAVWGVCKKHGVVDLGDQPWSWEDFYGEAEEGRNE